MLSEPVVDGSEHYRLLAEMATEIIFFSDRHTLQIIEANAAAARAYGRSREELRGLRVVDLRSPETLGDVPLSLELADRPEGCTFETLHVRRDGTIFAVEVIARTTTFEGRGIIVSTVRDITDRKRAEAHVSRLSRLLGLLINPRIDDRARLNAILREGSSSIQPGHVFVGHVSRMDGEQNVVEAILHPEGRDAPLDDLATVRKPGETADMRDVMQADILAAGRAVAWNDVHAIPVTLQRSFTRRAGWRSVIGAPLRVGATTYFLMFASRAPVSTPFTQSDCDYVDTLAAFLAARMQQARLVDQLRYQMEHDPLTGLPNRSQLRAAFTQVCEDTGTCTLALIDIDGFRKINETLGHMWGDAVLVEIGAALLAERRAGERVARITGNTFGIMLDPQMPTAELETRLNEWRRVFERPFKLGDRTGKKAVRLSTGFASASCEGGCTTFEAVLARANAALAQSRERRVHTDPQFVEA